MTVHLTAVLLGRFPRFSTFQIECTVTVMLIDAHVGAVLAVARELVTHRSLNRDMIASIIRAV